jgi:hypothetical protein
MFARMLSLTIVGLVLCGLTYDAAGQTKDAKKDAQKDKKLEIPKDAVDGTVKSVDLKANTFTITTTDKKDRTFKVDDKTEFHGPKGGSRGTGPAGLKDDCMEKGYEVKVSPAPKDAKLAKDVFLPNRKGDDKK